MAFGTLAFDTLSTSGQISGTAVSVDADYLAYGSAKAWVIGSNAAVLGNSLNISSGTDDGTGTYHYDYTAALANANFAGTVTSEVAGTIGSLDNGAHSKTTTNVFVAITNSSASAEDRSHSAKINGDLA